MSNASSAFLKFGNIFYFLEEFSYRNSLGAKAVSVLAK